MTRRPIKMWLCAGALMILGGCATPTRLSPDFGEALRQDGAAQVADPDAHYAGIPAPGSDGSRAGLAQDRYVKGHVIQPSATSTSSAVTGGGGGGSSATQ